MGGPVWSLELKENVHFDILQLLQIHSGLDETWNDNLSDSWQFASWVMCLIWSFFWIGRLYLSCVWQYSLVKSEHQKDKVLMRLREWTMCPKNMKHTRFNSEHHNLQGLCNHLKRKIIFNLASYSFLHLISNSDETWNENVCDSLQFANGMRPFATLIRWSELFAELELPTVGPIVFILWGAICSRIAWIDAAAAPSLLEYYSSKYKESASKQGYKTLPNVLFTCCSVGITNRFP